MIYTCFFFKERIKEENREAQSLKELLNVRINDYVEEVLMPYFGNLICFVKECEIIVEKDQPNLLKPYESKFNNPISFYFKYDI